MARQPLPLVDSPHRELSHGEGELGREFLGGQTVGTTDAEHQLRRMGELQGRLAGHPLEGTQVGCRQHESGAGKPLPPAAPHDGARDVLKWDHDLSNGLHLPVGPNLLPHAVRLTREAPLHHEAFALETQQSVDGLGRRRVPLRVHHVFAAAKVERNRGVVWHGLPDREAFGTRGRAAALPNFFGRTHIGAIQGVSAFVGVSASAAGPTLLALANDSTADWAAAAAVFVAVPVVIGLLSLTVTERAGSRLAAA